MLQGSRECDIPGSRKLLSRITHSPAAGATELRGAEGRPFRCCQLAHGPLPQGGWCKVGPGLSCLDKDNIQGSRRAMMTELADYANKYETVRVHREDGILQVTLHSGDGSLLWGEASHRELGYAFADIGADPENKVVILTGTGDDYCANFEPNRATRRNAHGLGQDLLGGEAPPDKPAGDRGACHRRGQRPGHHPRRDTRDVRHRAGLRDRHLPGRGRTFRAAWCRATASTSSGRCCWDRTGAGTSSSPGRRCRPRRPGTWEWWPRCCRANNCCPGPGNSPVSWPNGLPSLCATAVSR